MPNWVREVKIGSNNLSKIDPKTNLKQHASWDGFWIALGSIFGRFGAQVGGRVGAKLAPKSEEMGYQNDVKKSSKIWRRKGTQWFRSGRVSRPLKESLRDPLILEYKSTSALRACALGTLLYRARGPGADPIAFGQPAPGPGMKGCLDVWFLWLVGWLADWLFGLLVGCKIHQVGGGKSVNLFQKP